MLSSFAEVIDKDWESIVSQGLEARESKDNAQWILGKLSDKIESIYGEGSLKKYANSIHVEYGTLKRYRTVWRTFPNIGDRIPHLSHRHHLLAAGTDDPKAWLEKASDEGWSTGVMNLKIHGKEPHKKEVICPKCGYILGD